MKPVHGAMGGWPGAGDDVDTGTGPMPCAVGLLAATLALMTGHAAPDPGARIDTATLRRITARKIASHLCVLRQHPDLPPGLRQVAAQLHARWAPLADEAQPLPPAPATVH